MNVEVIHSFLVHPDKGGPTQTAIKGTRVTKAGPLLSLLTDIFLLSANEYPHEIIFNHAPNGTQQNDCRDLFVGYVSDPSHANGLRIAQRLQSVTTHRSKLGLAFVMLGRQGTRRRLVVSRFPIGHGITASEKPTKLDVKFVEVFLREAAAFKSVMYEGTSTTAHFWTGRALDRQINNEQNVAQYWIRDFLASDFSLTSAAGTKRFALALKAAIGSTEDIATKQQLSSLATLVPNVNTQVRSAAQLMADFHASPEAVAIVRQQFANDAMFDEQFQFSSEEFSRHLAYRSVELDNRGTLTAPADIFDDVFTQEPGAQVDSVRFSTDGKIVDDKLRKTK
jgi:hypothetical protein